MAQVKFYSVSNLPASPNDGGVYFVDGGELYKGSQRFGLPRVTTASTAEALSALTSKARGDINVGYQGAKVWDGTSEWLQLGDDPSYVTNLISGLVSGDGNSYITHITKDSNTGKLSAHAAPFNKTTVIRGIGTETSGSGTSGTPSDDSIPTEKAVADAINLIAGDFDADISALDARIDVLETHVVTADGSTTIYADAGNIGTITADTFYLGSTVGASTIPELVSSGIAGIAEATASSSSHGIIVSVTTQSGSVTEVSLDATAFDNVMHFLGTGSVTMSADKKTVTSVVLDDDSKTPVAGDIVLDTTKGLEVVCTGVTAGDTPTYTWELIGDQNTYAIKADVDNALASKASVGDTGWVTTNGLGFSITLASNADPTLVLSATGLADAASKITDSNTAIVTAKAVHDFVTAQVAGLNSTSTSTVNDVSVGVAIDASTNTLGVTLTGVGTAASKNWVSAITAANSNLPTESAVAAYVANYVSTSLGALDSTVSASDKGVEVQITQSDGLLHSATVTVTAATTAAYGETGASNVLATTSYVADYFNNNLVWLGSNNQPINV